MKRGVIITQPLNFLSNDILFCLIENTTLYNYHLCIVRSTHNSESLFKTLERKAKDSSVSISVINNNNNNVSQVKAASRYLKSRDDIESVLVLNKKKMSLIANFESFLTLLK
ncbi:hypothetical protein [Lutibacter sp. B1]|uniref:hypothetical protein n=1 Tax=Lutibacter sp. B1 TaxID=2725996 RepID=UPI0014573D98|nr:hypothetical protein [Lutibacter sp. B1]NLP59193.1 hypothetical protein [Lutibacter sp. B1]